MKKIFIVHFAEEYEECLCNIDSVHDNLLTAMSTLKKLLSMNRDFIGVITEHDLTDSLAEVKYWDEEGRDWD